MLRVRKNIRGNEVGNERIHDESIRANANNSIINTIELTEVKNGELTINSSLI